MSNELNVIAPFEYLKTKLAASDPLIEVVEGVPESSGSRLGAYLALGSVVIRSRGADLGAADQYFSSLIEFEVRYVAGFFYRVALQEPQAERRIMAVVEEFIRQVYTDRSLGGTVHSTSLDLSLADSPDYLALAGQEFRVYPVLVVCTQREVIPQA